MKSNALYLTFLIAFLGLQWPSSMLGNTDLEVEKIEFSGNTAIEAGELRDLLKSRQGEKFNNRFLNLDEILISNYYRLRGYRQVYVEGRFRREGKKIFIDYDIKEGFLFQLKDIRLSGNKVLSEQQVQRYLTIGPGNAYEPQVIEKGLNELENYYKNNGKPYAVLVKNEQEVEDSLVVLSVTIEEGVTVYIEEMRYEGLKLVQSFMINRELEFQRGSIYSREKIEKSQSNIYSTGLFRFVHYRLEPIDGDEQRVRMIWQLSEKKPLFVGLSFGVGYEEDDYQGNQTTFDFTVEAGHRNLFGTGRSLSMRFVPSFHYGRLDDDNDSPIEFRRPGTETSLTYGQPWLFGTRTPTALKISYLTRDRPLAPEELTQFSTTLSMRHEFGPYWSYSSALAFDLVDVESDSLLRSLNQGSQDKIYSIRFDPVKDKRDNFLNPTRGSLTEFRNEFVYSESRDTTATGEPVNPTNVFYKGAFQWNRYQKFAFAKKWVFATRIRGSGILEFGGRNPVELLPATELFYMGGANSVRGYKEQEIGRETINSLGDAVPVGGKYALLMNAELRIPLFWLFFGELFVDAGNLWEEFEDLKDFSLITSTGIGLAVLTPFGPIRFDYGFKLWPRPENDGDSIGEFHIGISYAF